MRKSARQLGFWGTVAAGVLASVLGAAALSATSWGAMACGWLLASSRPVISHLRGTSELPNWGVYLLALISAHAVIARARRLTMPNSPSVDSYNQDDFFGVRWRWSFIDGHPLSPWAFCPRCDTQLVYSHVGSTYGVDGMSTVLHCETCGADVHRHRGDKDYLVASVVRQIDRKIRNGEWRAAIEARQA